MSRTHNEFVTIFCNSCGSKFHPKYGSELTARFCSFVCSSQRYADKKHILQARIKSNIKIVNGCWEWNGKRNDKGYGIIRVGTYNIRAHRASYEAFKCEIPDGLVVCHSCDNPPCVNPDHLWTGTKKQNSQDMVIKDRCNPKPARGTEHKGHKLNEMQVKSIRNDNRIAKVIASEYGISMSLVYGIKNGDNWGWMK